MNIPNKYAIKDGTATPEGTSLVYCGLCGGAFAVPDDEAKNISESEVDLGNGKVEKICCCEECVSKADKINAMAAAAGMKSDEKVADELKRALGN